MRKRPKPPPLIPRLVHAFFRTAQLARGFISRWGWVLAEEKLRAELIYHQEDLELVSRVKGGNTYQELRESELSVEC